MQVQALEQEAPQVARQMATLPVPTAQSALMPPVMAPSSIGGGLPTAPAPAPRPANHSQEFEALTAKIKSRRGGAQG